MPNKKQKIIIFFMNSFEAIEIISLGTLGFIILNHKMGMNEIKILVGYQKVTAGNRQLILNFDIQLLTICDDHYVL